MPKKKKTTTRFKPKPATPPKKETPRATQIDMTNISPVDTCIAYKVVCATQEGQIMIADLMHRFGFSRHSTFDADPYRTTLNEGQRTVVMHIGRMIDADPAAFEDQNITEM